MYFLCTKRKLEAIILYTKPFYKLHIFELNATFFNDCQLDHFSAFDGWKNRGLKYDCYSLIAHIFQWQNRVEKYHT